MDIGTVITLAGFLAFAVVMLSGLHVDVEMLQRDCDELNRRTCRYCKQKAGKYSDECDFCGAPLMPNSVHWEVR